MKYPKKDDGVRLVTGVKRGFNKDGTPGMLANDGEEDDEVEPVLKRGFAQYDSDPEIDIIELAK